MEEGKIDDSEKRKNRWKKGERRWKKSGERNEGSANERKDEAE